MEGSRWGDEAGSGQVEERGFVAAAIRKKARKLKKTNSYSLVFICPDRTLIQRMEHKDCVAELRRRCQDRPSRHHLIRDGVVISIPIQISK